MAVNSSRSQRMDLIEGATDGKYRKVRPNTTAQPGSGDEQTLHNRTHLHSYYYDILTQEIPPNERAIPGA